MKISNASFIIAAAVASSSMGSSAAFCDPSHPDFVTHLPGYNQPLPSAWCSGFVSYEFHNRTIHTHYIFIRAEEDYDDDKPLIYFSNGGPGASSMWGIFTELGPLQLNDYSKQTEDYRSTGIPTPIYNPHNYARLANLLIIDQPAPVGFSYCDNETNSHYSCAGLGWTDQLTSENAYMALKGFFDMFPTYKDKDLYLVGESYAGVYIPNLAARILADPSANIRMKGLAVGDGCLGIDTGICGSLNSTTFTSGLVFSTLFFAGHGQIPLETALKVIQECKPDERSGKVEALGEPACQASVELLKSQLGGFFAYNLYDDCTYQHGLADSSSGGLYDYPCNGANVMVEYLKLAEVKQVLHVSHGHFFEVDNGVNFAYTATEKDVRGFYKDTNGKFRVLIYDGDADPCVNSFAARYWTSHMGFPEVESWRPWTLDGCRMMGGYVTRYEGGFDFLTIRGSGHMVPRYQPAAAFAFMQAWLENKDYPTYDETCVSPPASETSVA